MPAPPPMPSSHPEVKRSSWPWPVSFGPIIPVLAKFAKLGAGGGAGLVDGLGDGFDLAGGFVEPAGEALFEFLGFDRHFAASAREVGNVLLERFDPLFG